MKMLLAIINYDDSQGVINKMMQSGFSVTKLATTGGFLKAGNVTILAGLEEDRLDEAFSIIREHCRKFQRVILFITVSRRYTDNPGNSHIPALRKLFLPYLIQFFPNQVVHPADQAVTPVFAGRYPDPVQRRDAPDHILEH